MASFIATKGKPTVGFVPFGKAKVHVATDAPLKSFSTSFIPNVSFKADASTNGAFAVDVPDKLKAFRGRLIAFESVMVNTNLPGIPPIEILAPLYRSTPFKLSSVNDGVKNIFLHTFTTDNAKGITDAAVKQQAAKLRSSLKLDKISASVSSGHVAVTAEKKGGVLKFELHPKPSTSDNLDELIRLAAEDMDIDLPGPDWIVGLCVSKDDIEKQVRNGVKDLSASVNKDLQKMIESVAPGVSAIATITATKIRFPVTGSVTIKLPGIGNQTFPTRSIVIDPTAGVPRALF